MSDIRSSYSILKKQYYQLQLKENAPIDDFAGQAEVQKPIDCQIKEQQHNFEEINDLQESKRAGSSSLIEQILLKLDKLQDVQIDKIKVSENPADDIGLIKDLVSSYFWSGYYLGQQLAMDSSDQGDDGGNIHNDDNNHTFNNGNDYTDDNKYSNDNNFPHLDNSQSNNSSNRKSKATNGNDFTENVNPDIVSFDSSFTFDY